MEIIDVSACAQTHPEGLWFESGTPTYFWRDGREVECGGVLSCYSGNAIGGYVASLRLHLRKLLTFALARKCIKSLSFRDYFRAKFSVIIIALENSYYICV